MDINKQLTKRLSNPIDISSNYELYVALNDMVSDAIKKLPHIEGERKVYYISAEFLVGKQLGKNMINLGIYDEVANLLRENGKSVHDIEMEEKEPSLGNGGLGRLAACFLDSLASMNLHGDGVGLNYHYGLFKQKFRDFKQYESPDEWLDCPNALVDTKVSFPVELAGKTYYSHMYDLPIVGYHGGVNSLHLFDLDTVDEDIVRKGIQFDKTKIDKNLTLFLYPDDSDENGKLLRIYQQYFMVSNAAQLILYEEKKKGHNPRDLAKYVAIQINDTHPSMIIPELIRLLMEEGITMKDAIDIVRDTCAYTNHTILAEALEKWPLEYLQKVVPQLIPIIEGMDYAISIQYPFQDHLRIIDYDNRVHMAHMDIHYTHSTNGVAYLHTEILKHQELKPFHDLYPYKFNNKTNGISFRRWLMHCNQDLAAYLNEVIGNSWQSNAYDLEKLLEYYDNEEVLTKLEDIKRSKKSQLSKFIKKKERIELDPDSIFDVQVKRMHEYKRQQMNALWIIYKYLQIKEGNLPARPITVIFGAKAAPAYYMAKNIIHLIKVLAEIINNDPTVSPYLKVHMMTNYNIDKAERVIPSADISEQISLASKEASGTGNMKFMLNGAITLGTLDGANVEINNLVGNENMYLFGRSSDEVILLYNTSGYHPFDYYNNSQTIRRCVDFITCPLLTQIGDEEALQALQENLKHHDWFMTLLDLEEYIRVKEQCLADYENRDWWKRKSLVNIAKAGYFSSDRTIEEYNRDIWHL